MSRVIVSIVSIILLIVSSVGYYFGEMVLFLMGLGALLFWLGYCGWVNAPQWDDDANG